MVRVLLIAVFLIPEIGTKGLPAAYSIAADRHFEQLDFVATGLQNQPVTRPVVEGKQDLRQQHQRFAYAGAATSQLYAGHFF